MLSSLRAARDTVSHATRLAEKLGESVGIVAGKRPKSAEPLLVNKRKRPSAASAAQGSGAAGGGGDGDDEHDGVSLDPITTRFACVVDPGGASARAVELPQLLRQWSDGSVRVLVATSTLQRGVDLKPSPRAAFVAEAALGVGELDQFWGRAGRDGRPARCALFAKPPAALLSKLANIGRDGRAPGAPMSRAREREALRLIALACDANTCIRAMLAASRDEAHRDHGGEPPARGARRVTCGELGEGTQWCENCLRAARGDKDEAAAAREEDAARALRARVKSLREACPDVRDDESVAERLRADDGALPREMRVRAAAAAAWLQHLPDPLPLLRIRAAAKPATKSALRYLAEEQDASGHEESGSERTDSGSECAEATARKAARLREGNKSARHAHAAKRAVAQTLAEKTKKKKTKKKKEKKQQQQQQRDGSAARAASWRDHSRDKPLPEPTDEWRFHAASPPASVRRDLAELDVFTRSEAERLVLERGDACDERAWREAISNASDAARRALAREDARSRAGGDAAQPVLSCTLRMPTAREHRAARYEQPLVLEPRAPFAPGARKSCRRFRVHGSARFLHVEMAECPRPPKEDVETWLPPDGFELFGRRWQLYIPETEKAKSSSRSSRGNAGARGPCLVYFADARADELAAGAAADAHAARNMHIPLDRQGRDGMYVVKYIKRFRLEASDTTLGCVLEPGDIRFEGADADAEADAARDVMSGDVVVADGAGGIAPRTLAALGCDDADAVIVRVGAAKGGLQRDTTLTRGVRLTSSMIKFALPARAELAAAQRTIDVVRGAKAGAIGLDCLSLLLLERRGVPRGALLALLDECLAELRDALDVRGPRHEAAVRALADPPSERAAVQRHFGLAAAGEFARVGAAEQLRRLLAPGEGAPCFAVREPMVRDCVRKLVSERLAGLGRAFEQPAGDAPAGDRDARPNKGQLPVPLAKGRRLMLVADLSGALAQHECVIFLRDRDGAADGGGATPPVAGERTGRVIALRNPSYFVDDVRVLDAINPPHEFLTRYGGQPPRDTIVLSTRAIQLMGARACSIADMMSGGDYDGDDAMVLWDPALVGDLAPESNGRHADRGPELTARQKYGDERITADSDAGAVARALSDAFFRACGSGGALGILVTALRRTIARLAPDEPLPPHALELARAAFRQVDAPVESQLRRDLLRGDDNTRPFGPLLLAVHERLRQLQHDDDRDDDRTESVSKDDFDQELLSMARKAPPDKRQWATKFVRQYNDKIRSVCDEWDERIRSATTPPESDQRVREKKARIFGIQKDFQGRFMRQTDLVQREHDAVVLYAAAAGLACSKGRSWKAPWVVCADELITRKRLAMRDRDRQRSMAASS